MSATTAAGIGQSAPEESTNQDQGTAEQGPRANRATRRTFTAEFKRAIVEEYDSAPVGAKGAVLRRERLYDSHVKEWRAALEAGTLSKPTSAARRGRPKKSSEQVQIDQLTKELATERALHLRTQERLASSDAALNTLGKGVAFLEALSSKNAPSVAPDTSRGKPRA